LAVSKKMELTILPTIDPKLAQELLTIYGSPLYLYDGERLRQTIEHIARSMSYPHTKLHFASVTNGNIALLKIFKSAGWGLHANSPGDIYLGLQAGFAPSDIVYSGSNLDRSEMKQVLDWGIEMLNLDSLSQLQMVGEVYSERQDDRQMRLGLRLNEPSLTGDSRIGVQPNEFKAARQIAKMFGLSIEGLHFYRGTGTNATEAFTQVIERLLSIAQELPDLRYLDFGGGFGYPYHHGRVAFDWPQFGQSLEARLKDWGRPLELVIEPGRAAIAGSAMLLTKVVSVKWQDLKQVVGVDTTVANLSVPTVHGGYREIVLVDAVAQEDCYSTDVCGNTTYSRDYLGKGCKLPKLSIGDTLAILDVGAYGYAMSSHFLHRLRPVEVLLENNSHRLIRRREDYEVLLANQIFVEEL
jgi:diaminopimelate decarboxylase